MTLKAPFPWFGGKSRVADVVWRAFGNVPNYVEPFFGSGAVRVRRRTCASTLPRATLVSTTTRLSRQDA